MMKKFALLLVCSSAWAISLDDLFLDDPEPTRGTFDVQAELLYWKPTTGGYDYTAAIFGVPPAPTMVFTLKPADHWGYRLSAGYTTLGCCHYLKLSGLSLRSNDSAVQQVTGRSLLAPFDLFGPRIRAELVFDYWNTDFRAGSYIYKGTFASMHLFGGLRYAGLRERHTIIATANDGTITSAREKMAFYGTGPSFGLGGEVCLAEGFEVIANLAVHTLIGTRTHRIDRVSPPNPSHSPFSNVIAVVPATTAQVAFSYWQEICGILWSLEAGYELDHYFKPVSPSFDFAFQLQAASQRPRDIGFAGPYVRLAASF